MGEARVVNFQGFFQFGVQLDVRRECRRRRRSGVEDRLLDFRDDLPGVALFVERSKEALAPFFRRLREPRRSWQAREAPALERREEPRQVNVCVLRREPLARLPRSVQRAPHRSAPEHPFETFVERVLVDRHGRMGQGFC